MDEPTVPLALADAEKGAERRAVNDAARADEALVARARNGDQEAFRMLVDRHRDHAYGLALAITRSRPDAEDVAQEGFVRAWRALPGFRGEASFGTWLHRIVARRALDRAVVQRTRAAREIDIEAASDLAAPTTSEPRDLLLARRIERLMECLSAPQRAVVTLFYREDTPVQDIATVLAMPQNTVKTHLRRARASLREAWLREQGATS